MGVTSRRYDSSRDYEAVGRFLIDTYPGGDRLPNWMQPRWEYMHHHPFIEGLPLELILVFEDEGEIVGLVHPEDTLTFIYLQRAPAYDYILPEMLIHTDKFFGGTSVMLQRKIIGLFVTDADTPLEQLATVFGYERHAEQHEGYSRFDLSKPVPASPVPAGFRIQSLCDENDHRKINTCLWRGFNHDGEIPDDELNRPAVAQSAPNFRPEHTITAVAPDGSYVSYAGIWFVPENGLAYIEPVATDPDYRKIGLARACVYEAMRRVQAEGARVAWVGSDQPFYKAIGFDKKFQRNLWIKSLD
jgi:ribosomal protein S18 acetylase RimI-like enzyme